MGGFQLMSGIGNNKPMGVNDRNRGMVDSISSSIEHHVNHHDGLAFNALFSQAPTANDDCIFYLENTSDIDLTVEGVKLSVSAACEIYFKIGASGTRNGATVVVPGNCNGGSGNKADGNFEQGADLDGAPATLNGGYEIERFVFRAATDSESKNFEQDVILPKNTTLTMWCSAAGVTSTVTLPFNYHEAGEAG